MSVHAKSRVCRLILALFTAALLACNARQQVQEYITFGALLPLTGEDSDEGMRSLNGLLLAKSEVNEAGGILGKKLDIIILNDHGDENIIVEKYNELIKQGVVAVIGSSYSSVTMVLAKASEAEGLPVISPTASNFNVTKGRRNVFRAIFIDDYQSEAIAHFAINSLNAKTAVTMYNIEEESYRNMAEIFFKSFTERGGKVTATEVYSSIDEFPHILAKYTDAPPDVIYCPEDFFEAASLVNTAFDVGLNNTSILGADGYDGLLAYVVKPEAMKNVYFTTPFSFDDHDEAVSKFVVKYLDTFSQMPLTGSATAYTCIYILAEAIEIAGSTDKDAVISAMKANEPELITGRIKFDENNNPNINVYVIQIDGGFYSMYEKINLKE